jgi:deoxyribonuclease-4
MGTALGWRFEELAAILERLPDLPAGVCLDTAHTFEAGYDIRSAEGLERTLHQIDDTFGLGRIFVIHVNDSKTPLGSRVDRHEHVGKGRIGLEAFRRILNHPRLSAAGPQGLPGRAFILETPIDRPGDDRRNVKTLWALAGFTVKQAPRAEDGFSMLPKLHGKPSKRRKPQKKAKAAKKRRAGKSRRKG